MGTGRVSVVRAGGHQRWRRLLRALLSGVVLLVLLAPAGCSRLNRNRGAAAPPPLAASGPAGRLQEVAPPLAVQQLRGALDGRRPQLTIASPTDDSLLPSGAWSLRISGHDWPLSDAGELGLGAHLAVQVDDGLPRRLTGEGPAGERFALDVPMEPLTPGSHRITVMAMRPWGEVVKRPGASAQIRLHRVAANPLTLPDPGTPQLIVASPADLAGAEPVLLDWLLQDAPLQGLREGDERWRLRVTVNGDSFLVDQNAPLWLKGWRRGSNSVLMELVDARGEPINPPFNSVVREVTVGPAGPRPRWLGGTLNEPELAVLLGEIPAAEPELAPQDTAGGDGGAAEDPKDATAIPPAVAQADPIAGEPALPEPEPIDSEPIEPEQTEPGQGGAGLAEVPA